MLNKDQETNFKAYIDKYEKATNEGNLTAQNSAYKSINDYVLGATNAQWKDVVEGYTQILEEYSTTYDYEMIDGVLQVAYKDEPAQEPAVTPTPVADSVKSSSSDAPSKEDRKNIGVSDLPSMLDKHTMIETNAEGDVGVEARDKHDTLIGKAQKSEAEAIRKNVDLEGVRVNADGSYTPETKAAYDAMKEKPDVESEKPAKGYESVDYAAKLEAMLEAENAAASQDAPAEKMVSVGNNEITNQGVMTASSYVASEEDLANTVSVGNTMTLSGERNANETLVADELAAADNAQPDPIAQKESKAEMLPIVPAEKGSANPNRDNDNGQTGLAAALGNRQNDAAAERDAPPSVQEDSGYGIASTADSAAEPVTNQISGEVKVSAGPPPMQGGAYPQTDQSRPSAANSQVTYTGDTRSAASTEVVDAPDFHREQIPGRTGQGVTDANGVTTYGGTMTPEQSSAMYGPNVTSTSDGSPPISSDGISPMGAQKSNTASQGSDGPAGFGVMTADAGVSHGQEKYANETGVSAAVLKASQEVIEQTEGLKGMSDNGKPEGTSVAENTPTNPEHSPANFHAV